MTWTFWTVIAIAVIASFRFIGVRLGLLERRPITYTSKERLAWAIAIAAIPWLSCHRTNHDRQRKTPIRTMEEPMNKNKIPQTDSVQELAQFWDTHDITDFEEQLEEVTEPVFDREKVVQVHLPTKEAETVESMARLQGINPSELIRTWIMEKVQPLS